MESYSSLTILTLSEALIFEAPVNYGSRQTEAIICDHPDHKIVVFMFIVVSESFDSIRKAWVT